MIICRGQAVLRTALRTGANVEPRRIAMTLYSLSPHFRAMRYKDHRHLWTGPTQRCPAQVWIHTSGGTNVPHSDAQGREYFNIVTKAWL